MTLDYAYILSMIGTLATVGFALYGYSALTDNPNLILNRLFSAICISMTIWSFSFAVGYSVESIESALLWKRVSGFGFIVFYALVLHFMLEYTKVAKLNENRKFLLLLYLPSILMIPLFSTSFFGFGYKYNMIYTLLGWTHVLSLSTLDIVFYIYYIVYSLSILITLGISVQRGESQKKRQHSRFLLKVILLALILGTLFDVIITQVFDTSYPQISPILIMLPMTVALFAIDSSGDIHHIGRDDTTKIVKGGLSDRVHNYIHIPFIFGALISFVVERLHGRENLVYLVIISSFIASIGIITRKILRSEIRDSRKDFYVTLIVSMFFPVLFFHTLILKQGSVWAVSLIILAFFMLYNSRKMIMSISISILLTYLTVALIEPTYTVTITGGDHLVRIVVIILIVIAFILVSNFSVLRLKEYNYQVASQKLIADVSTIMVQIKDDEFETAMDDVLEKIGDFFEIDRCHFYLRNKGEKMLHHYNEWCREGISSIKNKIQTLDSERYIWWVKELKQKNIVSVASVDDLVKEADPERTVLKELGISSMVTVLLTNNSDFTGFISLDSLSVQENWNESKGSTLRILGNIISDSLSKKLAQDRIKELAYYDQLTGLPNRELFRISVASAIAKAERLGTGICLVMLDLDGFKHINDTYGHDAGDDLLVGVAKRMESHLRATDIISRFGGDEFLLLFENVKDVDAVEVIGRSIRDIFTEPITVGNIDHKITASIGLTFSKSKHADFLSLVKEADIAMYKAKYEGKDTFSVS